MNAPRGGYRPHPLTIGDGFRLGVGIFLFQLVLAVVFGGLFLLAVATGALAR